MTADTGKLAADVSGTPAAAAWRRFKTRAAASQAVAEQIADVLRSTLAHEDHATLVASGGSTPTACYDLLAQQALPWHRVSVLPSDERCVPADHADSNARMLREALLQGPASAATLLPLDIDAVTETPRPWSLALLGMGTDGHFASLFPDAENLAQGLRSDGDDLVLPIRTKASPHARVTLTWRALRACSNRLLLAFGADKAAVLDDPQGKPVATLLADPGLTVFWAP